MPTFRFRQFNVTDDGASHKVGTDGVLLGAWVDAGHPVSILDVGTGTGLIALMMAQRTPPETSITAIDINGEDVEQAIDNVKNSPWPQKVRVKQVALQQFREEENFSLIISNPPYFSGSLLPPSERRVHARHDASLPMADLLAGASRLLSPEGRLALILPAASFTELNDTARRHNLYLQRMTWFHSRAQKPAERALVEMGRTKKEFVADTLVLYRSGNTWSEEYEKLTGSFYLPRTSGNDQ